jgi:hypothetical protein
MTPASATRSGTRSRPGWRWRRSGADGSSGATRSHRSSGTRSARTPATLPTKIAERKAHSSTHSETISYADLDGATLTGADLSGATLTKANLYRATLTKADLRGATLTKADLSGATLDGAVTDDRTVMPQGYLQEQSRPSLAGL